MMTIKEKKIEVAFIAKLEDLKYSFKPSTESTSPIQNSPACVMKSSTPMYLLPLMR